MDEEGSDAVLGFLTVAQPVASPSKPGLNGTICSILSRGDSGPIDLRIIQTSSGALSSVLSITLARGALMHCSEHRWQMMGARMRTDQDAEKSGSGCFLLASPGAVVRSTEHRNHFALGTLVDKVSKNVAFGYTRDCTMTQGHSTWRSS